MILINDVLEIESIRVSPHLNEEVEGVGSGQILRANLTTPLWQMDISIPTSSLGVNTGRRIRALFNQLNKPGAFFYVYDPIAQFPQNDPLGLLHASATVTVRLASTSGTMSFAGAPANFTYLPGDMFHIEWGGRRGYFEISNVTNVNASGQTGSFETFPSIPTGIPVGTVVTLIRPQMKAQFVPGELDYATASSATWSWSNYSLRAIQKL